MLLCSINQWKMKTKSYNGNKTSLALVLVKIRANTEGMKFEKNPKHSEQKCPFSNQTTS